MAFVIKTKPKPATDDVTDAPAKAKPSFLKTGAAAVKAIAANEEIAAAKSQLHGKTYRFWLKENADGQITFLDGAIDPDTGILNIPYASEHLVDIAGEKENCICVEDQEPCPACQAGAKKSFCGYLTVLDHREWKDKDGKVVNATRRLYVAKSDTLKQLTALAADLPNGLIGATFDVSRTGSRKANVGDIIELNGVHEMEDIVKEFGEIATVLDYANELPYLSAEEMVKLGVGTKSATIGSSSGFGKKKSASFGAKKSSDVDTDEVPW